MAEDEVENRDLERSITHRFALRILVDRCVPSRGEMGGFLSLPREEIYRYKYSQRSSDT